MIKAFKRPAMIIIPFVLGAILPQLNRFQFIIPWCLCTMLYMVCLQINFSDIKVKRAHFLLLGINLLLGVIPYVVCRYLLQTNESIAMAAFFVGITPTATAAPVVMRFLEGKVEFVLTAFAITNIGVSLLMPMLLLWVTGNNSWEFFAQTARTLLIIMLLPLTLAVICRKICPKLQNLPKKTGNFTFLIWSTMLLIMSACASNFIRNNPDIKLNYLLIIALISALLCACNFTIGYFCSKKFPRECSQSLGQKNTTFTMYLALLYANPLAAMGPISYILWHNLWNALQLFFHDKNRQKESKICEN